MTVKNATTFRAGETQALAMRHTLSIPFVSAHYSNCRLKSTPCALFRTHQANVPHLNKENVRIVTRKKKQATALAVFHGSVQKVSTRSRKPSLTCQGKTSLQLSQGDARIIVRHCSLASKGSKPQEKRKTRTMTVKIRAAPNCFGSDDQNGTTQCRLPDHDKKTLGFLVTKSTSTHKMTRPSEQD